MTEEKPTTNPPVAPKPAAASVKVKNPAVAPVTPVAQSPQTRPETSVAPPKQAETAEEAAPSQVNTAQTPAANTAPTPTAKKVVPPVPKKPTKEGLAGKLSGIDLSFRISLTDKVFLARHLSTILKAGISLTESLKIVRDQNHGKLKKVLDDVIEKVENGKALNVALSDHQGDFDPLFINMIKVGEKSGTLDHSLQYLADQLSKDSKLISKVKSASLYPVIVLITAVGVGGGVSYFILPKLTRLFASFKADLPLATRILMWLSKSIEKQGIFWLAGLVVIVVGIWLLLKIKAVKYVWQRIVLHIPVAGRLAKSLNLARITLTLGTLLKNSVAIVEALNIAGDAITFLPYKQAIKTISTEVSQGKTIGEGIMKADPKGKLFEPTTKAMIHVGEKTGSLYTSLLYISDFYEEEVDDITKNMATVMEPILLIIIAVVVAFVAIAIISPMYQILSYINK